MDFYCSRCDNFFVFVNVVIKMEMGFVVENDFLAKIIINCFVFKHPDKRTTLHMVCWLQFLCQLNLVRVFLNLVKAKSFVKIRNVIVWAMPNCCEWRGIDIFGSSVILSRTVAMFSVEQLERAHTGVCMFCTDPVSSNLCTILRTVFFVGRLYGPKKS